MLFMSEFIHTISRAYKPIPSSHFIINRSRLFNSYEAIINGLIIILNYALFLKTNQINLINTLFVQCLIGIIGDYIVQITQAMRFMYSFILSIVSLSSLSVVFFLMIIRVNNVSKLCKLFTYYKRRHPSESSTIHLTCLEVKTYYIAWVVLNGVNGILRAFSIYFAYQAHKYIKTKRLIRRRKRKIE